MNLPVLGQVFCPGKFLGHSNRTFRLSLPKPTRWRGAFRTLYLSRHETVAWLLRAIPLAHDVLTLTTVLNCWNTIVMSKVITPHFEELIEKCIASGRFNNKSEVIRAGLRLLEEHETRTARASREDLSRIIQTALSDPRPLIPAASLIRRRRR